MLLLAVPAASQAGRNLDQFNYRKTVNNDYGPEDWDEVLCPDKSSCVSTKRCWCCLEDFRKTQLLTSSFNGLPFADWLAR